MRENHVTDDVNGGVGVPSATQSGGQFRGSRELFVEQVVTMVLIGLDGRIERMAKSK